MQLQNQALQAENIYLKVDKAAANHISDTSASTSGANVTTVSSNSDNKKPQSILNLKKNRGVFKYTGKRLTVFGCLWGEKKSILETGRTAALKELKKLWKSTSIGLLYSGSQHKECIWELKFVLKLFEAVEPAIHPLIDSIFPKEYSKLNQIRISLALLTFSIVLICSIWYRWEMALRKDVWAFSIV